MSGLTTGEIINISLSIGIALAIAITVVVLMKKLTKDPTGEEGEEKCENEFSNISLKWSVNDDEKNK